jgi:beta-glucosidase
MKRFRINWGNIFGERFRIQISSNLTTWTSVYTTTSGTGGDQTITLASTVSARYVRVLVQLRSSTAAGASIKDFNVFAV